MSQSPKTQAAWKAMSPEKQASAIAWQHLRQEDPEIRAIDNALQWFHSNLRKKAAQRERFKAFRQHQKSET